MKFEKANPVNLSRQLKHVAAFVAAALSCSAFAQDILVGYDFTTNSSPTATGTGVENASDVTGNGGAAAFAPNPAIGDNTGLAASGTTFGSTANGATGGTSQLLTENNLNAAIAQGDYVGFSFDSSAGGTLNLSGFSVDTAISNANRAANMFNILAQVNGGSMWTAASALVADQQTVAGQADADWQGTFVDLSGNALFQGINSAEFRIYLWGGNGSVSSSAARIDQVLVEGTFNPFVVLALPAAPAKPSAPQIVDVVDVGAISQLVGSAVPMNLAVGQAASNVHNVSARSLNQRVNRLRSRSSNQSFAMTSRQSLPDSVSTVRAAHLMGLLGINAPVNEELDEKLESDTAVSYDLDGGSGSKDVLDPDVVASGKNWVAYASADFGFYEVDPLGSSSGLESDTYSSTAGIEYIINDQWAVGAGLSHVWSNNSLTNGLGGFDIEGNAAMTYASYFKNNFWGDLLYSYGNYGVDIHRNTLLGSMVRAEPDLESHQATLNLGYNMTTARRVVHGPTFRADGGWGQLEGYTERGDFRANTVFREQDYESLVTTLGWQINWESETANGVKLRPNFRLGYGRENLDQETNVSGTLEQSPFYRVNADTGAVLGTGPTVTNSLRRIDPGEGWMEVGAGLGVEFTNRFGIYGDYQGRVFQDAAQLHLGTVKASWKW